MTETSQGQAETPVSVTKSQKHKLSVIVGGSVGSEPYSPMTWSGASSFLLGALTDEGILDGAFGITLPKLQNYFHLARNFNRNKAAWRLHYYFDPAYRRDLSRVAGKAPVSSSLVMQYGHMFSLPDAFPTKKCISYHDGNLAERLKSGFGFTGVSAKRIDQAVQYEEQVAGQMAAIFTFSEYLRQSFIQDYRVPANRVFNIGAGVNFAEIPAIDLAKDYTAPRVLFIGIEFERKGGPQLLEAFRIVRDAIPDAELNIVGPEAISSVPPGVVHHGRLSKRDPEQKRKFESLFRGTNLFVLPSLYEPFGIAPLEAMLYQLPCIVTDAWALRETVTPGFNGDLVARGSVEDLATKMIRLLSDPRKLATMGSQGRERVLGSYSWAAVAKRIASIISIM